MPVVHQSRFLNDFACLGDRCEDTCCKGWGMQVDSATRERYVRNAPELLEALDTGEAEHIMRRDPKTDHCVKFDQGLCGIHKDYGTDFLGDACHFFPRITRSLGGRAVMTAALSCPEVTRLALFTPQAFGHHEALIDRLPHSLKEYLPQGLSEEDALAVHRAFLDAAADETATAERIVARLSSVARSLAMLRVDSWPTATGFYVASADQRLPKPEPKPEDPFLILQALAGLLSAARPSARPRLDATIDEMGAALRMAPDPETGSLVASQDSYPAWLAMQTHWIDYAAAHFQPILRRWLQAQLSAALFPFAGLGATLPERITIIGVRFATLRLALMSHCQLRRTLPAQEDTVRIVQSLSRFLDHLADPSLSLAICGETGWVKESRLRAVAGDSITA